MHFTCMDHHAVGVRLPAGSLVALLSVELFSSVLGLNWQLIINDLTPSPRSCWPTL